MMSSPSRPTLPTTSAADDQPSGRILAVVRLHFANVYTTIVIPWAILGVIFVANLAIWWLIMSAVESASGRADVSERLGYNGAMGFIFVYMMVVAVQAITVTFPFALGYSATRRHYYVGTSITFVLLSVMYSAGLTLLSLLEDWTNGWGVGGRMFTAVFVDNGTWFERFLGFVSLFLFFFFVGAASAAVFVRWKSFGLTVFFVLLGFLLIGVGALITVSDQWGVVNAWFIAQGPGGVIAWLLVPTTLAALACYGILRRATPVA